MKGEKKIYRCPASHVDQSLSAALRHYPHAKGGIFPVSGGLLEQAPCYLHLNQVLSGECAKIQKAESDAHAAVAVAAGKKPKRNRG